MATPAGVVSPLPHVLPGGAIGRSGTAGSLPLGQVVTGTGDGIPHRGTAGEPITLGPVVPGAGAGARAARGSGGALSLPLTLGPGLGTAYRPTVARTGTAPPLTLGTVRTGAGAGSRASRGTAAPLPLPPLTVGAGSGIAGYVGTGQSTTIPLHVQPGAGTRSSTGAGADITLPLAVGRGEGERRRYCFSGPTSDQVEDIGPPRPEIRTRVAYGATVWHDADGWHTHFSPGPERLTGADRVYGGGRLYPLTDDERAELIAGGFADHITLERIA